MPETQSAPGITTRAKRDRYFLVERRSLWNRLRRKDIWREDRRCMFLQTARELADEFSSCELLFAEYRVRRTDVVRS